jgi:hypothetical protein
MLRKKIISIAKEKLNLFSRLRLTNLEKKVLNKKKFIKYDYNKKNLFFELVPDYYYLCYYVSLFNSKRFKNYNKIGIWTYFLPTQNNVNFATFVLRRIYQIIYYFLLKKKWVTLYRIAGISKCLNLTNSEFFFKKKKKFFGNKTELNNQKILNLKFKRILIGDLIYDTYLRFRNSPTINFKDKFINYLIFKCHEVIEDLQQLFKKYKPEIYFTGYCTYLQHGLPVRYFLSKKLKVYSGKNNIQLNKKLSQKHFYHHPNHKLFKENFNKMKNKNNIIKLSKDHLKLRYNQYSNLIPQYLKYNPYKKNRILEKKYLKKLKEVRGVLFLQNFHDAPHSWGKMIFPDFYTWCIYTLNLIRKYRLPIAVKPHPNEKFFVNVMKMPNIIDKLKIKYKDLIWLDSKLSNQFIFKYIKFGISASGSILYELALFNKIAISCGDHPGRYFNFCNEAKNQNEYRNLLINYKKLKKKKIKKNDLYVFNYMYNLDYQNAISLKNRNLENFLMKQKIFDFKDLSYIQKSN